MPRVFLPVDAFSRCGDDCGLFAMLGAVPARAQDDNIRTLRRPPRRRGRSEDVPPPRQSPRAAARLQTLSSASRLTGTGSTR